MEGCKPMKTPMTTNQKLQLDEGSDKVDERLYKSLVGSVIYLTNTRLVAKRILRYLKATKNHGLKYIHDEDNRLVGYRDSDWG